MDVYMECGACSGSEYDCRPGEPGFPEHYCDTHGPEHSSCCDLDDRDEQEDCLAEHPPQYEEHNEPLDALFVGAVFAPITSVVLLFMLTFWRDFDFHPKRDYHLLKKGVDTDAVVQGKSHWTTTHHSSEGGTTKECTESSQ